MIQKDSPNLKTDSCVFNINYFYFWIYSWKQNEKFGKWKFTKNDSQFNLCFLSQNEQMLDACTWLINILVSIIFNFQLFFISSILMWRNSWIWNEVNYPNNKKQIQNLLMKSPWKSPDSASRKAGIIEQENRRIFNKKGNNFELTDRW